AGDGRITGKCDTELLFTNRNANLECPGPAAGECSRCHPAPVGSVDDSVIRGPGRSTIDSAGEVRVELRTPISRTVEAVWRPLLAHGVLGRRASYRTRA